jgi:ribosomal protein S12 methylthiotransferase
MIKKSIPGVSLSTDIIVGFPGETEEDFQDLLTFIEAIQFDRVGAFKYSAVEGASANALADPVPEEIKEQRLAQLMALQSEISFKKLQKKIGLSMRVLIDAIDEKGIVARSAADAPDVDGLVFIEPADDFLLENPEHDQFAGLNPGDFIDVTIIDNSEHDLWAELV